MRAMNFSEMSEQDVRSAVIDPLIKALGYADGTVNFAKRDVSLRDPEVHIGRYKPGKGRPVGAVDYVLHVNEVPACVVEAKPPDEEIQSGLLQTLSYATHYEVDVMTYVISNGRTTAVFRTGQGSLLNPILSIEYEDLESRFGDLANLLSPSSLRKARAHLQYSPGRLLGEGLREIEPIADGTLNVIAVEPFLGRDVLNLASSIRRGAIRRASDGIEIEVFPWTANRNLESWRAMKGHRTTTYFSKSDLISSDASNPTSFRTSFPCPIEAGELVPQLDGSHALASKPLNITVELVLKLIVHNRVLRGYQQGLLVLSDGSLAENGDIEELRVHFIAEIEIFLESL